MTTRAGIAILAAMCSTLPLAAEPFHHGATGEWREYNRDWLAACPDRIDEGAADYYGFSCFASTASQELNAARLPAYKLTVFRNRLNGELDVALTVAADGVEVDPSRPLLVSFGTDPAESFDFVTDLETRYNTANQFYVVDEARKATLLDKMRERNAALLTIPLTGQHQSRQVRLSLRGLLASIDFMNAHARKVAQY